MDELCSTCLSKHRSLVPLSSIEVISSLQETIPFAGSPVLVCWECNSRLQKMRAFKSQATKAQELLKLYLENKKSLKALHSLSRLSLSSTKTDYDENFVYCMKQETMECEEDLVDDFQSEVKYDTEEHIPKVEKIDIGIQESYQSESRDIVNNYIQESHPSKSLYITVAPLRVEWPLSQATKEKVNDNESDINVPRTAVTTLSSDRVRPLLDIGLSQGTPQVSIHAHSNNPPQIIAPLSRPRPTGTKSRNVEVERNVGKLSKDQDNFDIRIMSFEEMNKLRDEDRQDPRFVSCPFKCRSCITGYFLEEKYNAHFLMRHSKDIGPHTCDICLSRHKTAELLSRHRETHFRSYYCRECPFASHKQHLMVSHQSEHGTKFSCEICEFSTLTKGKLRYHMNKMHKEDPVCKTCGKQFASVEGMRKHVLVKHNNGTKLEKCTICNGVYRNLAAHASTSCGPEAFCVECGVSFKNKLTFKRHLKVHSKHVQQNNDDSISTSCGPEAFCVECGVSFKNKLTFKRHLKVHSKHVQQNNDDSIRWYVCDECGYRSINKHSLKGHMASIHTKQYPFNCDICHKGFTRRSALRKHVMERHEGIERPRKDVCSYCGKAFKTKEVLINHIRTHTGERPFKCPHCPWSFTQRPALRTHMRALHPGADTGNTGAGGSGNTDDGGKAEKSGKGGKNVP